MFRRTLGTLLATLSLILPGCVSGNKSLERIDFSNYSLDKPFIAGVNGLATKTMESMIRELSAEFNFPYMISDVANWRDALPVIRRAYASGRNIVLTGASAGCNDVRMVASACSKEGIPISKIIYINPFYTNFAEPKIPSNVKVVESFFSRKFDLMFWANGSPEKFRGISDEHTYFDEPRLIESTHAGYFFNEEINKSFRRAVCSTN